MFKKCSGPYLLLGFVFCIQLDKGLQLTDAQFKQRFQTEVSVPYAACITSYNSILTHLSDLSSSYQKADVEPQKISPQLTNVINNFVGNVKTASNNSHSLAEATAASAVEQSALVSKVESDMKQNDKEIKKSKAQLTGKQKQVKQAKSQLNAARKSLDAYRNALQTAQRRYSDAKHRCMGKRRRRRHIDDPISVFIKMGEMLGQGVYDGLCVVGNLFSRNIDKATQDLKKAENLVKDAKAHLSRKEKELTNTRNHLKVLQKRHTGLTITRRQLQAQANSLRLKRDRILPIDQKIKRIVIFINCIKSNGLSAKLAIDPAYLLDATNLVAPIIEIGNAINGLSEKSPTGFALKLSASQITRLSSRISQIRENLKQFSDLQNRAEAVHNSAAPCFDNFGE